MLFLSKQGKISEVLSKAGVGRSIFEIFFFKLEHMKVIKLSKWTKTRTHSLGAKSSLKQNKKKETLQLLDASVERCLRIKLNWISLIAIYRFNPTILSSIHLHRAKRSIRLFLYDFFGEEM